MHATFVHVTATPPLLPGMRGSAPSVHPSVGWLFTPGTAGVPGVREGKPVPAHGPLHSSLRQQDHGLSPQLLTLSSGDLVSQQLWFSATTSWKTVGAGFLDKGALG